MYQVFKNGKTSIKTTFTSYEKARQAVRKLIRQTYPVNTTKPVPFAGVLGWTSNPQIGDFGYSIKKV